MRKTLEIIVIFALCGLAFGQENTKKTTTDCRGGGVMNGEAIVYQNQFSLNQENTNRSQSKLLSHAIGVVKTT
jgi:hypothetical protein